MRLEQVANLPGKQFTIYSLQFTVYCLTYSLQITIQFIVYQSVYSLPYNLQFTIQFTVYHTVYSLPCSLQFNISLQFNQFKSGATCDFTNYRPISLLSSFSKLLEKLVSSQMFRFIDKYK